jgi:hypothetical protein
MLDFREETHVGLHVKRPLLYIGYALQDSAITCDLHIGRLRQKKSPHFIQNNNALEQLLLLRVSHSLHIFAIISIRWGKGT